jgi:hypothetical protein
MGDQPVARPLSSQDTRKLRQINVYTTIRIRIVYISCSLSGHQDRHQPYSFVLSYPTILLYSVE